MDKEKVTAIFEQRIQQWLDEEVKKDPLFAERVKAVGDTKNIVGACNYVLSVARETGQAGWSDEEVYGLVRHYYDEDNVTDPGDQHPAKVVVSGHVDLTEQQIAEAKAQAVANYERELRAEAKRREQEAKEAEAKRREELKAQRKAQQEQTGQMDLFGF